MLYELRIYDIPQSRMKDINDRFANHTTKIWKRLGIRPVGFWENVIGPSNTLTYMLAWESLEEREKKWDAFSSDPEWHKVVEESIKNGQIVLKTHNTIMRPTSYSPMQ
ncbi:NIPSNAP family protein [Chloroflexota bacterium]